MNYEKIYSDLCLRARIRQITEKVGYETHHVIPRCFGGSNSKDNLVLLTYKEHYIAHRLLVKTSKTKRELVKNTEALRWLCKSNNGSRTVTSRMFEVARRLRSKAQSEFQREVVGPNGETRSEINSRALAPVVAVQTIHNWHHPVHGEETLSCYQLSLRYPELNGYSSNLLKVASGLRSNCRGWVLMQNKGRNFTEERSMKMSVSAKNRTDKRKNQWSSKKAMT